MRSLTQDDIDTLLVRLNDAGPRSYRDDEGYLVTGSTSAEGSLCHGR